MDKEIRFNAVARRFGFAGQYHFIKRGQIPDEVEVCGVEADKWVEFLHYVQQGFDWAQENKIQLEKHSPDGDIHTSTCIYLHDKITICYHRGTVSFYFDSGSNQEIVDELRNRICRIKPENSSQGVGIIRDGGGFLEVKIFKYSLPKHSVIGYLDETTQDFHQSMVNRLNAQDGSGLYLLYGKPGTGKTSFIKDVLSKTLKKALFISPCFTEDLTSPSLISLLMDYPDSILVIEDAETVLMERKADNSSAVSNLLNLTDGFLADFLNLKIICTFNTELKNIDEALLREGRLKGMHEFAKIQPERAQKIADVLG